MENPKDVVRKLNLYILQVISQLARNDIADTILRFDISREVAESLAKLNTAELDDLSMSPVFMFDINQKSILDALKDREQGHGYRSLHNSIVGVCALINDEDK